MSLLSPSRRRRAASLPLGALAVLAITTNALGAYWTPTVQVSGPALRVTDLSTSGRQVAAAWVTGSSHDPWRLWVADSTNSGDGFAARVRLAVDPARTVVPYVSLDSGGGRHWAAFTEKRGTAGNPTHEQVFIASKPFGAGAWRYQPVSLNSDLTRWPDVTRTPGRLFVSYVARIGSSWKVVVQSSKNDGASFEAPVILGTASDAPIAIDATPTTVSVVWNAAASGSGSIQLKRGHISGAPDYSVTWQPTRTLATGSAPTVVMDGHRVAVFSIRQADVFGRLSSNDGVTFGPERRILDGDPGDEPGAAYYTSVDAALSGNRIVVDGGGGVVEGAGFGKRATSNDAGVRWSTVDETDGIQVAFVGDQSAPKICQAWSDGDPVRYHRQA